MVDNKFTICKSIILLSILVWFLFSNGIIAQVRITADSLLFDGLPVKSWVETDEVKRVGFTLPEEFSKGTSDSELSFSLDLPDTTGFNKVLFRWYPKTSGSISQIKIFFFRKENEGHPVPENIISGDYSLDGDNTFPFRMSGPLLTESGNYSGEEGNIFNCIEAYEALLHSDEVKKTAGDPKVIYGFNEGEMTAVGIMIPPDLLLEEPNTTLLIDHPEEYYKEGYYPDDIRIDYNSGEHSYDIFIENFQYHKGREELIKEDAVVPDSYALFQNYPNPFNPSTNIKFQVPEKQQITLKVYDILGKEIAVLVDEEKETGIYEIVFDASELSSGVYFYTIKAGRFEHTRKMLLLK